MLYCQTEHSDTQLVACCDIDEAKAIAFSNHFGFARHYTDYIQMLCAERPDAVTLNVPYTATCELACGIMTLGYPLILEKPPGCTGFWCGCTGSSRIHTMDIHFSIEK